jgi:hypothetical protein
MIFGALLDRITPWLGRIALALFVGLLVILALNYASCSRQEAAQSKQTARSEKAGTKTAGEALDTLEGAQERDAGTDRIVTQGKKDITDAKTDVEADAAARRSLCKLRSYRDSDPACKLLGVHP